eukprot:g44293.t1
MVNQDLVEPKLGITEQVIAELLAGTYDNTFHHFTDDLEWTNGAGNGPVGFVLPFVCRMYLDDVPHYVATLVSYCSLDLEYFIVKWCSYYLSREFTSAILTAVYMPSQGKIYTAANALEMKFPKALFIVAGNFNQANLVLPKYHRGAVSPAPTTPDTPVPSVTITDIRSVFLRVNPRKATGLDEVPGHALGTCVDQLAEVFIDILNLSLLQAEVPTCCKKTIIIPVPKKAHAMCLNDYCLVALTSIIMKCFERLVMAHINSSLPACLDPLQFAYQHNSKTKELIIDFRKNGRQHALIYISGVEAERVKSVKFLGMMITDNLSWTSHVDVMVKKIQQRLFFLRLLRKFSMSIRTLTNFYRCTRESILSGCIVAWYGNCSVQDCKKLQKI